MRVNFRTSGGFIKQVGSPLVKLLLLKLPYGTCFCCLFVNCCICPFDICLRVAVSVHTVRAVLCLLCAFVIVFVAVVAVVVVVVAS